MPNNNMDTVELKQVIITTLTRRGDGKEKPIRIILEVWDAKTGEKIAEKDSLENAK